MDLLAVSLHCRMVMMRTCGHDVSVGLDDGFEVPSYESVVERLENRYGRLAHHRNSYTTRNIPRRDQLKEELYALGVRFNPEHESY